jgi:hypothetical protein
MKVIELKIFINPPNAVPEWQAGSLRRRGGELVVACPLEGLVRLPKVASKWTKW